MAKRGIKGKCFACGEESFLNFEHIPPASCGNKQTKYTNISLKDMFIPLSSQKKKVQQGGSGNFAFCSKCNNNFGSWYVKDYSDLYKQTIKVLKIRTQSSLSVENTYEIYPLRIIKQVVCMFLAINHSQNLVEDLSELKEFVLNKTKTKLPEQYKIFAYHHFGGKPRMVPFIKLLNLSSSLSFNLYSENAFPPFGFVLAKNAPKPDNRLVDITYFANYEYDTKKKILMQWPILPTHSHYPCTYKTKSEIKRAQFQFP